MKIIKILVFFIILFFLAAILILGYFGFIPGLSSIMGADKPKDLGISYSSAQYDSFGKKLNGDVEVITSAVEPADSVIYSQEKINTNDNFSQEELSARLNYSKWKYMPVKNVQLRINKDGSVEFSANISLKRLPGFIEREGMGQYSIDDVKRGLDFINMLRIDPPVYMKFNASVKKNELSNSIDAIQVGRFDVPLDKVDADSTAKAVFQSIISKAPAFYAQSVEFKEGKMSFKGSLPAKMSVEVEK